MAIAVIGVTAWTMSSRSDVSVLSNSPSGLSGSMMDMISGKLGNDIMCEFEQPIANQGSLSVQSYISGNHLRVNYLMIGTFWGPNADQKNLYIINDGEYSYVWGDSLIGDVMSGMKYKTEYDDQGDWEMPEDSMIEGFMAFEDMPQVNCKPWSTDQSLFEIPDDIEFMDLDDLGSFMMDDFADTPADGVIDPGATASTNLADGCDLCELFTDSTAKASCLESMGCE